MAVVLDTDTQSYDKYRYSVDGDLRMVSTVRELYTDLENNPEEDLVVVGPDIDISVVADVAERYRTLRSSVGFVVVRRRLDVSILNQAMRAGVREVVNADDSAALAAACQRSLAISRELHGQAGEERAIRLGSLIIIFSAKGGCGKTTVSTNLADAIQRQTGQRVCLVDFDLQFGDVGVALQVEPIRTISDAVSMHTTLDAAGVASLVVPYRDNFDLLLAPLDPADVEHISGELAHKVLSHLQTMYDYVVVDSPPAFTEVVLNTFDLADYFVMLTTLDMPAIKNLKVSIDTLDKLGMPRSKFKVIVNRSDAKAGLKIEDVEDAIGIKISEHIPTSMDVPASTNAGVTLVSAKPNHPVSQSMFRIAKLVVTEPAKAASGIGSIFSRVRKK